MDRTAAKFVTHAEQESETLRYWRDKATPEKFEVVAELAMLYSSMHKIDLNAQGPKRTAIRLERPRS